ncbi:chaperonin 10-like protein [Nemania abortiva]|nr:chaperonin 10-like protein [Nemania abortiva]
MTIDTKCPTIPEGKQTAIVQQDVTNLAGQNGSIPLTISHDVPMPSPTVPAHSVLVRVLAVALNPTDYKMPVHLPMPGTTTGCDFCGIVIKASPEQEASFPAGTRVAGTTFAYNEARPLDGAFAQYTVGDARLMVRVPPSWTDLEGAALGGVGWRTATLALWDEEKLGLRSPSNPIEGEEQPVLVYGGTTATGTMAIQLLKLSGYRPIAITSPASAYLAKQYGAAATASYLSPSVAEDAQAAAGGKHKIRHALDCITTAESAAMCFSTIARRGGRYVCLEALEDGWVTRQAVHTNVAMGYETTGIDHDFGPSSPYTRLADPALHERGVRWAAEVQALLDVGKLTHHPVREIKGGWDGIIKGLELLRRGKVSGEKLVVRIPQDGSM